MGQITCSFVKFGCLIGIFLYSAHLICRSTDISKNLRGSLRLRDNESRLYFEVMATFPSAIPHLTRRTLVQLAIIGVRK